MSRDVWDKLGSKVHAFLCVLSLIFRKYCMLRKLCVTKLGNNK